MAVTIKKRFAGSYYVANADTNINIIHRMDGFWYVDVENHSDLNDRCKSKAEAVAVAEYVLSIVG